MPAKALAIAAGRDVIPFRSFIGHSLDCRMSLSYIASSRGAPNETKVQLGLSGRSGTLKRRREANHDGRRTPSRGSATARHPLEKVGSLPLGAPVGYRPRRLQ